MYPDLNGKIGLITGAGKANGIGYAIARKLAACGSHLIITDLTTAADRETPDSELQRLAETLRQDWKVTVLPVALDVACPDDIKRMAAVVSSHFERVDILVNNAGTAIGVPADIRSFKEADWMKTMDINLHGVFRVSRAILPMMKGQPAAVINLSSRAGKVPPLWNGAYAVSKAAVIMLTKVMALELAGENIRVNAICPGLVMTDFQQYRLELEAAYFQSTVEERAKELAGRVPLGRLGTADEVAELAAFLASNASSYLTGQAINIGGGLTMAL
jgi:NAD(P)-dependent dehydrogenase (short-subunit alcohol dehydrogenase family)